MFRTLKSRHPRDKDMAQRTHDLAVFKSVLDGTLYDVLQYQFHEERSGNGEYIPVANRAPCVRYNLARMVVEDSISLLFGDSHFPSIVVSDEATRDALVALARETHLDALMSDAAMRGSIGSVAIRLRILKGRVFFDVFDTLYLTPQYDPDAPDTLVGITERYKVRGSELRALGYDIPDENTASEHWFQRDWDANNETWFVPILCSLVAEGRKPQIDTNRTIRHQLGVCPWVWIKNTSTSGTIDGACTFASAIETQIEIEYQLSLGGRALKYSAAPTLMLKDPSGNSQIAVAAGDTITVAEKGDAKWLEIDGSANDAVREYVRLLREIALESVHGNRSNADKLSAGQSGRAIELMHQPLIWLADKLRVSYGECGILPLLKLVVVASQKYQIKVAGQPIKLDPSAEITLAWPRWFPPTAEDRSADAGTLRTLTQSGLMSRQTAVGQIAPVYDVADANKEMAAIQADQSKADARLSAQAAQIKATEPVEASA